MGYETKKYKEYLKSLVVRERSDFSYNILFETAWDIDFSYSIPNDRNRSNDGKDLRYRYMREHSVILPDLGECRMLEMLIALAIRWNEIIDQWTSWDCVSYYFWEMIANLELDTAIDDWYIDSKVIEHDIRTAFDILINRRYGWNGSGGGLFPLINPHEDQTKVEIWFQLMAYISENNTL